MAKEKKCDCEKGAPLWVVTFGDMMSLLMTFFVLLLSFATLEEPKRYSETLLAIKGAFGVLPREQTLVQINPMPAPMKKPSERQETSARRIQRSMQMHPVSEDVQVKYDESGGVRITLPAALLFEPGETELRPEVYPVLNDLADVLSDLDGAFFEIRGHTDDTPLGEGSRFRDNIDLSYARADGVARYLSQVGRMPLQQFQIVACGAGQPVAPNNTAEGRAANRRVDIYVRSLLTRAEERDLKERVRTLTNP